MIEIRNLVKIFDKDTVLRYRDYRFEDGKSYCLLGASGCGKSTLLNMLAGVITPDSGSVLYDGRDMTAATPRARDRFRVDSIGYIFQDFKLIENMTVADNIEILRLEGVDTHDLDEVLSCFGILGKKKKKVRTLSGGEKQRVAIARAFVKHPPVILADEPTGNLNYEIGRHVTEELLAVSKGKTLIAVTHDDRLSAFFDVVLDMNEMVSAQPTAPMGGADRA